MSYEMSLLREILPPVLYRVLTRRRFHSLNGIDRKLWSHLNKTAGYFVELGANDGVTQSNTLFFEREHGWRGILIEPAVNRFLECVANRSAENRFYCAACVPFDYASEVVWLDYHDLMTFSRSLPSDLQDVNAHADAARPHVRGAAPELTFPARALPLNDVLIHAGAPPKIDLLSLDVEGAELAVLQGVDFDRFNFNHMVIECREVERLRKFLEPKGYLFAHQLSAHDYHFIHMTARVLR